MEEQTIYGIDSVLEGINGYENKTVRELIEKSHNRDIWKLIKRGIQFDDEVLNECNINKEIRDERVYWEVVNRSREKPSKTYKKDTANYDEIVESLSHVEVEEEEPANEEQDEIEEFFEHDDDE
ncbi:MAG: hypothetical protein J6X18_06895 [Bacteroidales bacterium]|nr:hypothetical protein [Bacteroidales bacterium]